MKWGSLSEKTDKRERTVKYTILDGGGEWGVYLKGTKIKEKRKKIKI